MTDHRFVITAERAGVTSLLEKAFSRGPRAGFKYLKRIPYFQGGKLRWRYFYRDEKELRGQVAHHDPHEEHEHVLISDVHEFHPNLRGKVASTIETTITVLKQLFGFEKGAKIDSTDRFFEKRVKPYIETEEAGEAPKRESPMARSKKAFEMLPDSVKAMVDPAVLKDAQGSYKGLKDFQFNEVDDKEGMIGALGWAQRHTGKLRIDGRVFDGHIGLPQFGSPLTLGESVIWHEWGHHVHYALENYPKGTPQHVAWETWRKGLPGERITPYAGTNAYEDFAETFACALAHPKELAEKCPTRYEWMRDHVLHELPTIEDLLKIPDEELAWWESKPDTPASRTLAHLKKRKPAPMFHSFYSPKDQFYQVSKDGRVVYLRVGPAHKEEEEHWVGIPPTTYTETIKGPDGQDIEVELPRNENGLGARFKKTESIKEIYDENGYPLTDRQAFFFLGIDDPKGVNAAEKAESPEAYADALEHLEEHKAATAKKKRSGAGSLSVEEKKLLTTKPAEYATHALSYEMYTTMGFKQAHTRSKEIERLNKLVERFKKVRAKFKKSGKGSLSDSERRLVLDDEDGLREVPDFTLDRHAWAPHEISDEREFVQKSGTFKFSGIRSAPEQPYISRTADGGTQMVYDPATGKEKPVLTAEVFEQENPDGTFTRIMINKSAPFALGQKILVPDGRVGYRYHVLKKGDPLDAYELARKFDTTGKQLLQINQRFDRGQITDPILAALINPHDKPIDDASQLQQMMRDAAKDRRLDPATGKIVGRRAWVTIRGDVHADAGIGHLQVEFDGSGPPRVVGDYWARKFGKVDLRIDELLNKQDEIDVPRIQERKPKRNPIKTGHFVRVEDPKSGKQLLARMVRKKGDGYEVTIEKGQGTGLSSGTIFVPRVKATSEDLVPGSPKLKKRLVSPLKEHLLLYMDEVPRDSGSNSPEGVIKILLPSDGSIQVDELMRMPGVRVFGGSDVSGHEYITISGEDLPKFRNRVGGFVMDSRVKAKLVALEQKTRALNAEADKQQVVEATDLEDEDGNINPEGPLGGLITGDEGIQPGDHRIRALMKLAKNKGRLYAAHFMGCLSGDTEIPINRAAKGFTITLRELYERQELGSTGWDMEHPTFATSLFDQHLRLNEVLNVVDSGEQETFLVRTKVGREIRATAMHPFWTPNGWVSLSDLKPGDRVGVRGAVEPAGRAPKKYKYPYRTALWGHPYAGVRGAKTSPFRVPTHRLVAEARLNSMDLDTFVRKCRAKDITGLQFLDPTVYAVHHKNEDTLDNSPENLEVLPHSDHWRLHGEKDGWTNFNQFRVGWDEVEFVGDEQIEATYDIVMHVQAQSYVANDFVVHNTGKTALAIMASEMMRKLKDPESGEPHKDRTTKRTLTVVPLNTAENWFQEHVKFGRPPTLIGAGTLSGAQQIPKLPKRKSNESDKGYAKRVIAFWKDGLEAHPNWWNPWEDTSDDVVVPFEYFRDNEEALRALSQFDGLIVDEAHKIARDNETSRAIERWNPAMKLFLLLSGTPITNTLHTLPRIVELVSGGATKLGTPEEFAKRNLIPSNVMRAMGKSKAPLTDINPQKVGELAAILQSVMDVATTADVKGKSMPAVLLDENEPAHMTGMQAQIYRAAMSALTDEERSALGMSAALGVEEEGLLSVHSRRKIGLARSVANSLAYKQPDQREDAVFVDTEVEAGKGSAELRIRNVVKVFSLPTVQQMTGTRKKGFWGNKWPTAADIEKGVVTEGYYNALHKYMPRILGMPYDRLEGKTISAGLLKKVRAGTMETETGESWNREGGKLKNPDYGPEGMICRGQLDEVSGRIEPLIARYFDSQSGEYREIQVPVGKRFVRDYRSKASGLYYDEDDWDWTGRFSDEGEHGGEGGGEEDGEPKKAPVKGMQGPKLASEGMDVQRHPARRKQRAQFDLATTHGNAKCAKLEQTLRNIFASDTGSGAQGQAIIFGRQIGSSCRTAESKLRTMGYMDVNEALGHSAWSSDADKQRAMGTRKFFVSYLGKSATLGDRDINSEIFRRVQDQFGKDTGTSIFVQRTMFGTGKDKRLKPGQMEEPWGRQHRKKIAKQFADGTGKTNKNGSVAGLEVPMRIVGYKDPKSGAVSERYIYESDVPVKIRKQVSDLEVKMRSQRGAEKDKTHAETQRLLAKFVTDRKPLTDAQIDIFNNCQVMLASDAANVGLNWPCNDLVMYDSLFSPMEEWQRITRAARMLPPAISTQTKPHIEKIGAYIEKMEEKSGFKEYKDVDSAMMIVEEAMNNALSPAELSELNDLPGGGPAQIVEAYFANRAFEKIASLRDTVGTTLRKEGAVPDPTKPPGPSNFVPPEAITESDVMNEILRKHLTGFDREIMKSRRYMVHVHRLLTSVDMPMMQTVTIGTGKRKKKVEIPTGEFETQSPSLAERSQLSQQRAKMVPYEFLLKIIQNAMPEHTQYDFIESHVGSLGAFSRLPDETPETPAQFKEPSEKSLFWVPLGGH